MQQVLKKGTSWSGTSDYWLLAGSIYQSVEWFTETFLLINGNYSTPIFQALPYPSDSHIDRSLFLHHDEKAHQDSLQWDWKDKFIRLKLQRMKADQSERQWKSSSSMNFLSRCSHWYQCRVLSSAARYEIQRNGFFWSQKKHSILLRFDLYLFWSVLTTALTHVLNWVMNDSVNTVQLGVCTKRREVKIKNIPTHAVILEPLGPWEKSILPDPSGRK